MNRIIIFSLGAVVLLVVFVVWVYLIFFGTPSDSDEVFADLGFGSEATEQGTRPTTTPSNTEPESTTVNVGQPLAQLTTNAIAGADFVGTATSTTHIYFAERGTGHVYQIDLESGTETRVLGKTFSRITDAYFAPSGRAVVLKAENGYEHTAYLEEITDATTTPAHNFAADAENIAFVSNTEVRYTRDTASGMTGYAYHLDTTNTEQLFTIPFTDATVIWTDIRTLVFNNPAPFHKGGLYEITNNTLTRIGETAYGLTALATDGAYARTFMSIENNAYLSYVNGELQPLTIIPEKCVFAPQDTAMMWCAAPSNDVNRTYLRDWYQGTITSNDLLWILDTAEKRADVAVNFANRTGRTVDVTELAINPAGDRLLFTNKIDNALWLYTPQSTNATSTESATTTESS